MSFPPSSSRPLSMPIIPPVWAERSSSQNRRPQRGQNQYRAPGWIAEQLPTRQQPVLPNCCPVHQGKLGSFSHATVRGRTATRSWRSRRQAEMGRSDATAPPRLGPVPQRCRAPSRPGSCHGGSAYQHRDPAAAVDRRRTTEPSSVSCSRGTYVSKAGISRGGSSGWTGRCTSSANQVSHLTERAPRRCCVAARPHRRVLDPLEFGLVASTRRPCRWVRSSLSCMASGASGPP